MHQSTRQLEKDIRHTRESYAAGLTELASLVGSSDNAKNLMGEAEEFGVDIALEAGQGDVQVLRPQLETLLQITHRLDLLIGERERLTADPNGSRTIALFGEDISLDEVSDMEAVEPRAAPDPSRIEALEGKARTRRRGRSR